MLPSFAKARQFSALLSRFAEILPETRTRLATLRKTHSNTVVDNMTLAQLLGGMRGSKLILTATSTVDPQEGILFRGLTVREVLRKLPRSERYPMTEGMLFLLMTGELPTHEEVEDLRLELIARARLPAETIALMQSLPANIPSLTQLSMGLLSLQTHSHFAKAYTQGIKKSEYWKPIFEDSLDLIARLPVIAAYIYKTKYRIGPVGRIDEQLDWAANFGNMIGFHDRTLHEFLRMYTIIHSDNSGGNVSAHATHLVGSALSDPYLSYSAGLNGLSGPLHGLAGQAFMKWLIKARGELGDRSTEARLEAYVRKTLEAGQRIPAFGHEVLKVEDPRFLCQKDFALTYAGNDPLCRMVNLCHRVIPKVLKEVLKVEHPWPNLYAYTGAILHHYGISEYEYFSVLFGVSRAIGCMSQLIWSRGLGMPIERPGSVNVEILQKLTS